MTKVKNRRDNHYVKRPKSGAAYGESEGTFGMRQERDAHKKIGEKYAVREDAKKRAAAVGTGKNGSAGGAESIGRGKTAKTGRGYTSYTHFSAPAHFCDIEMKQDSNILVGRNPVTEALRAGREIDKILVSSKEGSIKIILALAKEKGIPVIYVEKAAIDRLASGKAHQGVAAYISPYDYAEIEDIFTKAEESGEEPFIIILDGLEDPHNLGAIMRSAECAGAHGVIIPKRHSCGLTETVAKASAGAIEYMPVVKVTNIAQTIDELKERGIWTAACDMGGSLYCDTDISGKIAVVIGSEGFGISKLVREKCDYVVSMPMLGKITSLNASNAAAVIMYEIRRQRDSKR